jgi:hypothetical protein
MKKVGEDFKRDLVWLLRFHMPFSLSFIVFFPFISFLQAEPWFTTGCMNSSLDCFQTVKTHLQACETKNIIIRKLNGACFTYYCLN